jgi:NhaP-type Na+/H+ or K+/H+ antiporter
MEALTAAVAVNAASILLLGIVSGFIKERLWVSEPLIAMLIGLGFGPSGPNLINLHLTQEQELMILREASHLTLAISVMGAALRLPLAYEAKHWRELLAVLLLGMPLMWVVTSGLIWLVLGSGIVLASAIGAVLTPTDPVLADSILTGRLAQQSIPQRMRDSLSAESGANDGLALLLVALPGLVLIAPHDTALLHWVLRGLLQEILGGLLLGLVVGWLFARLTRWAYTKPFTDESSILTSAIALALFVLALGRLLGLAAVSPSIGCRRCTRRPCMSARRRPSPGSSISRSSSISAPCCPGASGSPWGGGGP